METLARRCGMDLIRRRRRRRRSHGAGRLSCVREHREHRCPCVASVCGVLLDFLAQMGRGDRKAGHRIHPDRLLGDCVAFRAADRWTHVRFPPLSAYSGLGDRLRLAGVIGGYGAGDWRRLPLAMAPQVRHCRHRRGTHHRRPSSGWCLFVRRRTAGPVGQHGNGASPAAWPSPLYSGRARSSRRSGDTARRPARAARRRLAVAVGLRRASLPQRSLERLSCARTRPGGSGSVCDVSQPPVDPTDGAI